MIAFDVTRTELTALREKYEEILRLREAQAAGDDRDPRPAMAALASRFPGALREIDELPVESIGARIRALRDAEGTGRHEPWMLAMHLFHALTRGALIAKRWLAAQGLRTPAAVDGDTREAYERHAATLARAEDALAWSEDLARLAAPPHGRVTELVYERVATHLGASPRDVRVLVFGASRRERLASVH